MPTKIVAAFLSASMMYYDAQLSGSVAGSIPVGVLIKLRRCQLGQIRYWSAVSICVGTPSCVVAVMRMINCKYGYVSPIEAKIFGELDRELKRKKRQRRYSIKQQPISLLAAKKECKHGK